MKAKKIKAFDTIAHQNPNGTKKGITAVCSEDGRATIMMPHPERAFLNSQLSWTNLKGEGFSPWIKMFINARKYF